MARRKIGEFRRRSAPPRLRMVVTSISRSSRGAGNVRRRPAHLPRPTQGVHPRREAHQEPGSTARHHGAAVLPVAGRVGRDLPLGVERRRRRAAVRRRHAR